MNRRAQDPERDRQAPVRRVLGRRGNWLAGAVSVGAHAALLLALLSARVEPPMVPAVEPISVALVAPPPPPPPPPPPKVPTPKAPAPAAAAAPPSPAKSPPRSHLKPTRRPPPPDVEPLPASEIPTPAPVFGLGEAELAGATTAGSGAGGGGAGGDGGGCDMVRLIQDGLRKNPRIQSAIARAHPDAVAAGKAILVWDGDWMRNAGEEGKGLAGIRQAIAMEVAFAPEPCRADPVHGLVLISLNDGPRSVRLALGTGRWHWSDLALAQSTRRG